MGAHGDAPRKTLSVCYLARRVTAPRHGAAARGGEPPRAMARRRTATVSQGNETVWQMERTMRPRKGRGEGCVATGRGRCARPRGTGGAWGTARGGCNGTAPRGAGDARVGGAMGTSRPTATGHGGGRMAMGARQWDDAARRSAAGPPGSRPAAMGPDHGGRQWGGAVKAGMGRKRKFSLTGTEKFDCIGIRFTPGN